MITEGRLETLDIVFNLTTIDAAKADDPSHCATVYKGHVVEGLGLRGVQVFKPPHTRTFWNLTKYPPAR
jgi:hypothetical protein